MLTSTEKLQYLANAMYANGLGIDQIEDIFETVETLYNKEGLVKYSAIFAEEAKSALDNLADYEEVVEEEIED